MLKIYCSECGSPTEYSLNKPKFCSSCGRSFQENIQANKSPGKDIATKKDFNKFKPIENDLEEDDFSAVNEDIDVSKINIKNLNIEYSKDDRDETKIKDLIGTSSGGNPLRRIKTKKQKINKKQFLEDFQKEAGTLRRKNV